MAFASPLEQALLVPMVLVAQPSEEDLGFRRSAVADKTIVRLFFGTEKVGGGNSFTMKTQTFSTIVDSCESSGQKYTHPASDASSKAGCEEIEA